MKANKKITSGSNKHILAQYIILLFFSIYPLTSRLPFWTCWYGLVRYLMNSTLTHFSDAIGVRWPWALIPDILCIFVRFCRPCGVKTCFGKTILDWSISSVAMSLYWKTPPTAEIKAVLPILIGCSPIMWYWISFWNLKIKNKV